MIKSTVNDNIECILNDRGSNSEGGAMSRNDNGKSYKIENPELAEAMRDLRRSSAASPHDNRPRRLRTRADVNLHEIRMNME